MIAHEFLRKFGRPAIGRTKFYLLGRRVSFPWRLCLLVFVLIGSCTDSSKAETHFFPWKNLSLQDVLNDAHSGDTIMVAPGTYQLFCDNLVITHEFLVLKSSDGPEKTILQGRGKGPVVSFAQGSKAVLEGFTITSVPKRLGVKLDGGGVYCASESAPVIKNNIIKDNEAVFGGGIYCDTLSAPTISNNMLTHNKARVSGGGIFSFRSAALISNNNFNGNTAGNSGGAIGSQRDTSRINNNVLWKNKAGFGGGISCDRSATIIANNTIVDNSAKYGGGIGVDKGSVRLNNLILWRNVSGDLFLKQVGPPARPENSFIGDRGYRGINGNISGDPRFAAADKGDFQLLPDSPCVDSGNVAPFYQDIDGSVNDMGAYGGSDFVPHSFDFNRK